MMNWSEFCHKELYKCLSLYVLWGVHGGLLKAVDASFLMSSIWNWFSHLEIWLNAFYSFSWDTQTTHFLCSLWQWLFSWLIIMQSTFNFSELRLPFLPFVATRCLVVNVYFLGTRQQNLSVHREIKLISNY